VATPMYRTEKNIERVAEPIVKY